MTIADTTKHSDTYLPAAAYDRLLGEVAGVWLEWARLKA